MFSARDEARQEAAQLPVLCLSPPRSHTQHEGTPCSNEHNAGLSPRVERQSPAQPQGQPGPQLHRRSRAGPQRADLSKSRFFSCKPVKWVQLQCALSQLSRESNN